MELKPCPFCGSESPTAGFDDSVREIVICTCGAIGPPRETEQEAIEAWNCRAVAESDNPLEFDTDNIFSCCEKLAQAIQAAEKTRQEKPKIDVADVSWASAAAMWKTIDGNAPPITDGAAMRPCLLYYPGVEWPELRLCVGYYNDGDGWDHAEKHTSLEYIYHGQEPTRFAEIGTPKEVTSNG